MSQEERQMLLGLNEPKPTYNAEVGLVKNIERDQVLHCHLCAEWNKWLPFGAQKVIRQGRSTFIQIYKCVTCGCVVMVHGDEWEFDPSFDYNEVN